MTTTPTKPAQSKNARSLTDEQLNEVIGLLKGVNSVELKLTVSESDQRSAMRALKMDPLDAQIRQVCFFDTPDLALNKQGLVVRARRVQGKTADSAVKVRPVDPNDLPDELKMSPNVKVELDAMPGGFVVSATIKGRSDNASIRQATFGNLPIRKLFSKEQRSYYKAHAPDAPDLDQLTVLGPITLFKLEFMPEELERELVAELWMYPDNSRILELSTKCAPNEMFQVATETRVYLSNQGIDLTGEQQTKTKTALEYYVKNQPEKIGKS
jgi:hypothetical protein